MANGFVNWGAIVTALIVALVVSLPMQALAALFLQPWAMRRQRRADKHEAPTMCPGCKTEVPAWFIVRPGDRCRMCRATFWRYPAEGDTAKRLDREHRLLARKGAKSRAKAVAAAQKKRQLPPPSTPEE